MFVTKTQEGRESFNFKFDPAYQAIILKAFTILFTQALTYFRDAIEEVSQSYNIEGGDVLPTPTPPLSGPVSVLLRNSLFATVNWLAVGILALGPGLPVTVALSVSV